MMPAPTEIAETFACALARHVLSGHANGEPFEQVHCVRKFQPGDPAALLGLVDGMAGDLAGRIGSKRVSAVPPVLPWGIFGASVSVDGVGARLVFFLPPDGSPTMRFDVRCA